MKTKYFPAATRRQISQRVYARLAIWLDQQAQVVRTYDFEDQLDDWLAMTALGPWWIRRPSYTPAAEKLLYLHTQFQWAEAGHTIALAGNSGKWNHHWELLAKGAPNVVADQILEEMQQRILEVLCCQVTPIQLQQVAEATRAGVLAKRQGVLPGYRPGF